MDEYSRSPNPKRFYRHTDDKLVAGVFAGLADRMGWNLALLRIAAVLAFITGFLTGPLFFGYLIVWAVTPARRNGRPLSEEEDSFWRGVSDRPRVTLANIRYKFMDLEDRLQGLEKSVTSDEWRLRRQFRDLEN